MAASSQRCYPLGSNFNILIVGGSSYVGQALADALAENTALSVGCTFNDIPVETSNTTNFQMNFQCRSSIENCLSKFLPSVVVNLAAISSPTQCEKNPEHALAVNSPSLFLEILQEYAPEASIIHMSTDQVWGGEMRGKYQETSVVCPVNIYGETKIEFEKLLMEKWQKYVILRCSVIYGPEPQRSCNKKGTFLQFVLDNLREEKEFLLFSDEFRNFIHIDDAVQTLKFFVENSAFAAINKGQNMSMVWGVYNMGGPECLSRSAFAERVAKIHSLSPKGIKGIPRSECKAAWAHACGQPKNLDMNVTRLEHITGVKFKTLEQSLRGEI